MASIQRMIKSGIRVYNYNPQVVNVASPLINRLGARANLYRWLCSRSCSDGQLTFSNAKRTFNVDTSDMLNTLKAEGGIPHEKAKAITRSMTEYLAALEKNSAEPCPSLVYSKYKSLRKNMKKCKKDPEPVVKMSGVSYEFKGFVVLVLCGTYIWSLKIDADNRKSYMKVS